MADIILKRSFVRSRIHPHKFALWVSMASIVMMFGALTSAYLVRMAQGNWLEYSVPGIFFWSTGILLLSSGTLHISYRSFTKGKAQLYRLLLVTTFLLGLTFVIMQYFGWQALYANGVPLDGNPAGSFFYVISGLHAAHVLGGIAAITVALLHAIGLKFRVTEKRKNRFELVLHYWHFVDLLWVYLLFFILFAH